MRLNLRIAGWMALLLLASVLGTATVQRFVLGRVAAQQRETAGALYLQGLLRSVEDEDDLRRALRNDIRLAGVVLYDAQGRELGRHENSGVDGTGPRVEVALTQPPRRVVGRFAADQPALPDTRGAESFLLYYALLNAAVVLFVAAWLIGRRLVRPVARLLTQVEARAGRDLRSALSESRGDELGRLGSSLRQLLGELADREVDLEEKLEQIERTQHELVATSRLATVGRLAAGVAHEIGNPLAAIKGLVELVAEGELEGEVRADTLRRIEKEVQRVDATVRGLLDYARQRETHIEPVLLRPALDEAWALVLPGRRGTGVQFENQVGGELPAVSVDPARFEQVLVNLLLNAVDAIGKQPGGIIRATAEGQSSPPRVQLRIADNGPGVPEEQREGIFDPFVTTKGEGQGTGLGLAISVDLVEAMGATLQLADSEPELGGACFALTLKISS